MTTRRQINEGEVYYPKAIDALHSFRRIVGVVDDRVFYSVGGDRVINCSRKTFINATKSNDHIEVEE